jgi:hypothetical protein
MTSVSFVPPEEKPEVPVHQPSSLEGNGLEITPAKLYEELNSHNSRTQLSDFLPRLHGSLFCDLFTCIANGVVIESDIVEAAALSPAVQEQLSVDSCALKFVLNDVGIRLFDICSLQCLLSGEAISGGPSQSLLSCFLENASLEQLFFGCSKADIRMSLSDLLKEKRNAF